MDSTDALTITLPKELAQRVVREAHALGVTPTQCALQALDAAVAPAQNSAEGHATRGLAQLTGFLGRVPCVTVLSHSAPTEPLWWVKLVIDITCPLAWHVVQGLGHVLNYLSVDEPLPTVFRPVSPPPYLNGGPSEYLAWVVEAQIPLLDAAVIASFLENRLPQPVDEEAQWLNKDDPNELEED